MKKRFLQLSIVGLVSLNIISCTTTQQSLEVTSKIKSIDKHQQLSDLIVESFVIDEYIEVFNVDKSCKLTDEIKQDINDSIMPYIEPWTNDEVQEYVNFLNDGGLAVSKKYYRFIYDTASDISLLNNPSDFESIIGNQLRQLFNTLSTSEIQALFNVRNLPNRDVREDLFPINGNNFNLTQTSNLVSILKDSYLKNCQ